MILVTDLKNGTAFKENETPYVVVKYEHVKTARGGATVRIKAKNLLTGAVLEKSYSSNIKVEDADVTRKNAQYLYKDQNGYVFMDPDSYEQMTISEDTIGETSRFLTEGQTVQVQYFEGNPIAVDLPLTMDFEISYTEPGFRGNTVTNAYKDATLSNDVVVKVPPFIKIGDWVKIDTRTGDYISKA
jgi:elongation factor P